MFNKIIKVLLIHFIVMIVVSGCTKVKTNPKDNYSRKNYEIKNINI